MANERRVRQNFVSGTITDNPLTNTATTMNSAGLAGLEAIDATEHAVLVLDPTGAGNGPEVVYVTAHTGSATAATIVRGREGTVGVAHATGVAWVHVATANDFIQSVTSTARPAGGGLPYEGQMIYETDTKRELRYNGTVWVTISPVVNYVAAASPIVGPTGYIDLATFGPQVSIQTGTSVIISAGAYVSCHAGATVVAFAVAVSGATTIGPQEVCTYSLEGGNGWPWATNNETLMSGLNPGVNTFTAKYKNNGSGVDFGGRYLRVTGLP
jgi:hypothetical protein